MRFSGPKGIARIAPFLAAFLLCLVISLYPHQLTQFLASTIVSTDFPDGHSAPADAGKSAGGHELAGGYLTVVLEEAEAASQRPINAGYLTALLWVVFFGVVLGVLGGKQTWHRKEILLFSERRVAPATGSPPPELTPPLLSVFLL